MPTRPTTDRARESLFNILTNLCDIESFVALDLFGGTGAHSLELYSRGAKKVTYVDNNRSAVSFIRSTVENLEITQDIEVIQSGVMPFLKNTNNRYNYIFADPPYSYPELSQLPDTILQSKLMEKGSYLVLEHDRRHNFSDHPDYEDHRVYGTVEYSFFRSK